MSNQTIHDSVSKADLRDYLSDVVYQLLETIDDLNDQQRVGVYHRLVNPPLWEVTHALWFIEHWVLRDVLDRDPYFEDIDDVYNSINIRHGRRWDVDLIPYDEVRTFSEYLVEELSRAIEDHYEDEHFSYRLLYSIYHGDMHTEAETFQRQERGLPAPPMVDGAPVDPDDDHDDQLITRDVEIEGGTFPLGSPKSEPFVFDNEKWAHDVEVDDFVIAATPVTNAQYRAFVEDGGYRRREFWSDESWEWVQITGFESPRFWKQRNGEWHRRWFDQWIPLEDTKPVIHVSWYEARAYCRWADRRLPTEAEWELAAIGWGSGEPGQLRAQDKARFPWDQAQPTPDQANLDWNHPGTESVLAHPAGDSPTGCRQMIGNLWEWTSTPFERLPSFEPDFYLQYSQPWFGSRYVLRGGSWSTRSRLIRTQFRNFYTPDRNDRFLGFRTCPAGE